MRIRHGILWTAITLSFVACDFKGCSSSSTVEEQSESQVNEQCSVKDKGICSSEVGEESSAVTLRVGDTADIADLRTMKVSAADAMPISAISEPKLPAETIDVASIPEREETEEPQEVPLVSDSEVETEELEVKNDTVSGGTLSVLDADSMHCVRDTSIVALPIMQPAEQEAQDTVSSNNHIDEKVAPYVIKRGMIRRDATEALFIPKGQWMLGAQMTWNQWDSENLSYLVLDNLNFQGHTFSVGPSLGYFFTNNMAVGGRFSYKRNYLNVDEIGLGLGEGLSFDLKDFYYLQHSYKSSLFLRSYIPIGESKIFGLFGECQLNYTFSEGKNSIGKGDMLTGVYEKNHSLGLGLGGGMVVFLTDFAAAEVMLNVGGCDFKWGYQNIKEIDRREKGYLTSSGANFKIDLFSIKFGLTFYL